jgi:hypothetical protein
MMSSYHGVHSFVFVLLYLVKFDNGMDDAVLLNNITFFLYDMAARFNDCAFDFFLKLH